MIEELKRTWYRMARFGIDQQLITDTNVRAAGRHFQDRVTAAHRWYDAPRLHRRAHGNDLALAVEHHDVERATHKAGVHRRARHQQDAGSRCQRRAELQTAQARPEAVGNFQGRDDDLAAIALRQAPRGHWPPRTP